MESSYLYKKALEYVEFGINNLVFSVPYMINDGSRFCSALTKGKGTVGEIKSEFLFRARNEKVDLEKLTPNEAKKLMADWGIGIDCSGIVFNLTQSWLKHELKINFSRKISRYKGLKGFLDRTIPFSHKVFRIGAETLLSDVNTYKIASVSDLRIGDFISTTPPNWPTKHILLVVDKTSEKITYINSSDNFTDKNGVHLGICKENGAHLGFIEIVDQEKDLRSQKWMELTFQNDNFGALCYLPEKGDSVRRLRFLSKITT